MATTSVLTAITSKPKSKSVKTCQGTVIYAGAKASGSPITTSLDISMNLHTGTHGAKVKGGDSLATIAAGTATGPTFKPYSSGTFAYWNNSKFILFGNPLTNTLSGVANTKLTFPSNDAVHNKNNRTEKYRTLHQSSWVWTTGKATTATVTLDWAGVVATDSTDHAARPTRAVPGEFTYLETGKTPTNADYPAKTL